MEVDAQGYGREPIAMVRGVLSCLFVPLFLTSQIVPVLEASRDAFSSAFTRMNIKEAWEATTLLSDDHSSIEKQLPVSNPIRR